MAFRPPEGRLAKHSALVNIAKTLKTAFGTSSPLACWLEFQILRRRPSSGSVMGTRLVRPVPLPRRLPTAGDRLLFVRTPIEEQAALKKFSSVKFHSLFDHLGDECERRQEWRRDQPCPVPLCDSRSPKKSPVASPDIGLQLQPFSGGSTGVDWHFSALR